MTDVTPVLSQIESGDPSAAEQLRLLIGDIAQQSDLQCIGTDSWPVYIIRRIQGPEQHIGAASAF